MPKKGDIKCMICNGTGQDHRPGFDGSSCRACGGSGWLRHPW